MNDVNKQYAYLMSKSIADYRASRIVLNSLILKIEAIRDVVDDDKLKDQLYEFVLSLEQINAFIIEERRRATENECNSITLLLDELESLIKHFMESQTASSAHK